MHRSELKCARTRIIARNLPPIKTASYNLQSQKLSYWQEDSLPVKKSLQMKKISTSYPGNHHSSDPTDGYRPYSCCVEIGSTHYPVHIPPWTVFHPICMGKG